MRSCAEVVSVNTIEAGEQLEVDVGLIEPDIDHEVKLELIELGGNLRNER